MKLNINSSELKTIIASLEKSSHYFEEHNIHEEGAAEWLQEIRQKLIRQAEGQGELKDYFVKA